MAGTKIKILLADDEANIRLLGEKLLKEAGYDVVIAANGSEAIEKAIAEKPDLVITDIKMPQKTGFEVCKTLRNDPVLAHVPIIILSALGDEFNKLTGFEGGANDFITKPFRADELKERVSLLLERITKKPSEVIEVQEAVPQKIVLVPTGAENLDKLLGGGLPKGSNILMIGAVGRGKSTFTRRFILEGLSKNESCLFVMVDDDPVMVRGEFDRSIHGATPAQYEVKNILRFVDAFSWSSGQEKKNEKFKIEGVLSLEQLSNLISLAGNEIGQSIHRKAGGRRVIDSVSSFFVNFELPAVQRFLSQIGRTAHAFGGVTTLYTVEEGAVDEQGLNNIKYLMDGVLEFKEDYGRRKARVSNMKWIKFEKDWVEI